MPFLWLCTTKLQMRFFFLHLKETLLNTEVCIWIRLRLHWSLMAAWVACDEREPAYGGRCSKKMQGLKRRVLWMLHVNRAVVHTVPLTSCEDCSQWETNLQRMSPSDIQETLHWSLLHCSRHTIAVLSTLPLMALIYIYGNAWKTFTFCLQRGKEKAVAVRKKEMIKLFFLFCFLSTASCEDFPGCVIPFPHQTI